MPQMFTPQKSPIRQSVREKISRPALENGDKDRSPSPRKSMGYKPDYEIKSTLNDIIDPVYENVDPISVTSKTRQQAGSVSTQISGGKKDAYFFTLGLTGSGCPIENKKK